MSIRRDYKPVSTWQRRRQVARFYGLLVITLVLIGLFGGFLAYIRGDRVQPIPVAAAPPSIPPAVSSTPPVSLPEPAPEAAKPKYDFYTELPKRQVDIQQEDRNSSPPPRPAQPQPTGNPPRKPAALRRAVRTPFIATQALNAKFTLSFESAPDILIFNPQFNGLPPGFRLS